MLLPIYVVSISNFWQFAKVMLKKDIVCYKIKKMLEGTSDKQHVLC